MKATLILFFAAVAAPSLSMRIRHSPTQQHSSISTSSSTPNSSSKHVHLSPGSGGAMNCARLEAKHEYYMAQVQELKSQNISVPAYLAGYASAAADALQTLGCPVKSGSTASEGTSSE